MFTFIHRGLAAAVITCLTGTGVSAAIVGAAATANENQNKDDHPRAVVATKEVVTHSICLLSMKTVALGGCPFAFDFLITFYPMPKFKNGYTNIKLNINNKI